MTVPLCVKNHQEKSSLIKYLSTVVNKNNRNRFNSSVLTLVLK